MTKETRTYSASIKRLDKILENIDQSDVPIDELADQVIEAAGLLKDCKRILTDTEAKVKDVLADLDSEFGVEEKIEEP